MKDRLLHWLMRICMFLLKGAGWAAVGVFVGFFVSYFFRLPGRVDTFALTETLLGVVITGLAIVGAFMVVLQWSNLESKMQAFDAKVKETNEFFDKTSARAMKIAEDIDAYVKATIDGYKENVDYLDGLLKENAKTANEINSKVDEYKAFYEEKAREIEEKQEEWINLIEKAIEFRKDDDET